MSRGLGDVYKRQLSVPFNYLYCDGSTQNIWGDGVIESMEKVGFNSFFSHCMGQFYLDFLDKVITIVLVFSLIKLVQKKMYLKDSILCS